MSRFIASGNAEKCSNPPGAATMFTSDDSRRARLLQCSLIDVE
ncbi:hypothetical protein BRPE67_DCDS12670 (plasmid) [Caballeronia cordobensis]|nr:hypothetical protein BRPE67_DCDS12670 [Burkholderia sp. RPE67]